MNEAKKICILDTSAILTYIEDEDGSDYVEHLLIDAEKGTVDIYVSFISLTEVFYITLREKDEPLGLERIKLILCQIHNGILVHKDPEYEKLASEIKEYRLPYKLS